MRECLCLCEYLFFLLGAHWGGELNLGEIVFDGNDPGSCAHRTNVQHQNLDVDMDSFDELFEQHVSKLNHLFHKSAILQSKIIKQLGLVERYDD